MALLEWTAGYSFSNSFCFLIVFKTEVRMKYFFAVTQLTVFIDPNRTSFFFFQAVAWRNCSDPEHEAMLGAGVSVQ